MRHYLGIDLGGTNIAACVTNADYELLAKHHRPTQHTRPFEEIVADMAEAARQTLRQAGLAESDVAYVGIGVPSPVHPVTRRVVFANNLMWRDLDLVSEFQKHWDIPVYLGNDADCAALGESVAGAAKDYDSVMLITLGTGVGGGLVIGKKLFLGGDGFGTEPGHVTLVDDGFPCTCGRLGCVEAYASVTALIRQSLDAMSVYPHSLMWDECERDMNRVNGRTAFDAAKKGDAPAKAVVERYIRYLGHAISSYHTLFRPEVYLIGGGVSNEGEYLLSPLRAIVAGTIHGKGTMETPKILKARLGNDAGLIGAALLGVQ